jgi:chromosome segregation ATPase
MKMKKEIEELNKKMNLNKEQYNSKNKELMDEIKKKDLQISTLLKNENNYKNNENNFKNNENNFKNEINTLKEEINNYKNKINSYEEKMKTYEDTIEELKKKLNELSNDDKLKEDEMKKNIKMNEEREKEIQNLKNQILSEKENNEKLNAKIKELKDEYEQKISSLNEQLSQKDIEINKIKEDIQFSSKSSQDLMNKHKEEIERIKFSNTLTINELKLKHENEISSLKIENMKIKESLDKAKEMEALLHKLKLQLQQKNTQEIELNEKEEKFKKMHIDAVNKLKFEFQNSIKALQQKNENYENDIRELENLIICRA